MVYVGTDNTERINLGSKHPRKLLFNVWNNVHWLGTCMQVYVDTDDDLRLSRRILRDVDVRGRDVAGVIQQYTRFVKPAQDKFVTPSRKFADVIIPWHECDSFPLFTIIIPPVALFCVPIYRPGHPETIQFSYTQHYSSDKSMPRRFLFRFEMEIAESLIENYNSYFCAYITAFHRIGFGCGNDNENLRCVVVLPSWYIG